MAILLDHLIVPSRIRRFGAVPRDPVRHPVGGGTGHFTPVYVNETLTLDSTSGSSLLAITTAFTSAMRSSTRSSHACRQRASSTQLAARP